MNMNRLEKTITNPNMISREIKDYVDSNSVTLDELRLTLMVTTEYGREIEFCNFYVHKIFKNDMSLHPYHYDVIGNALFIRNNVMCRMDKEAIHYFADELQFRVESLIHDETFIEKYASMYYSDDRRYLYKNGNFQVVRHMPEIKNIDKIKLYKKISNTIVKLLKGNKINIDPSMDRDVLKSLKVLLKTFDEKEKRILIGKFSDDYSFTFMRAILGRMYSRFDYLDNMYGEIDIAVAYKIIDFINSESYCKSYIRKKLIYDFTNQGKKEKKDTEIDMFSSDCKAVKKSKKKSSKKDDLDFSYVGANIRLA